MKKFLKDWKLAFFIAPVIFSIALFIRLYNLTILPVFADEAIYIRWSQIMANESTLRFLPLSDGKQPLYMWILMFIVHQFNDPLFIGRLISVGAGIGTIVGLFALTYLLFKNKIVSLATAFLWALSPYAVFFDRMALVDALLTMLGVWTAFFGVLTAKTKRLDMAMITGFALGFAFLTKSSALFFALLLPLGFLLTDWPKTWRSRFYTLLKLGLLLAVIYVIAFFLYNIQRLGPNFHMLTLRTKDYIFPISHLWENPKDPFIFHYHRSLEWIWIMGPAAVFILAGIGFFLNLKKNLRQQLFLLAWWLIPSLIQAEYAKVYTARYELFTIPFILAIAGSSLLVRQKFMRALTSVGFVIFVVESSVFNYFLLTDPQKANLPRGERSGYLEEWTAGTGIKETAEFIKEEHARNPEERIVIGTEGYFGTLPDGLQMYLEGVPNVIVIGVGLHISEVHPSLADSFKAGNKTYLVANSSRLNFKKDFEEYGLKVVKAFRKADRPEDIKEFVQYGKNDTFYLFEVANISKPAN